nr:MAG TPA: hypothetical protein [Ackermannviridae sp.]
MTTYYTLIESAKFLKSLSRTSALYHFFLLFISQYVIHFHS